MVIHVDPKPAETESIESRFIEVTIMRLDEDITGQQVRAVVYSESIGPLDSNEYRETVNTKVVVHWEDSEHHHIIDVSTSENHPVSFTLAAMVETPLSQHSVLIAALIMIIVYTFNLLEFFHRTLVSIYGSMVALFFFFLIHGGETESIRTIMLHQEWSTLGLLFGMMLLVGELSHTGIFEFMSVRLLLMSKG